MLIFIFKYTFCNLYSHRFYFAIFLELKTIFMGSLYVFTSRNGNIITSMEYLSGHLNNEVLANRL